LDFLERDAQLAFFFHRGDSSGEGGSGQRWDSELFPELMKKVPKGRESLFLTTGEPGGAAVPESIETPRRMDHVGRSNVTYYHGKMKAG
jgi:hypothetical protein